MRGVTPMLRLLLRRLRRKDAMPAHVAPFGALRVSEAIEAVDWKAAGEAFGRALCDLRLDERQRRELRASLAEIPRGNV